ncbi:MAG: hypothetical protein K6T55_07630 [Syntrophobacterales bacterium]|nr:hypothetical protein [Syntrophobacterales bacterium]
MKKPGSAAATSAVGPRKSPEAWFRRKWLKALLVSGGVGLLLAGAVWHGGIPLSRLYPRLLRPLLNACVAIGVGLAVGLFIENAGLTTRIGRLAAPLLRFGHLREASAVAFTTAFFSALSASTILMNAHRDQAITREELTISALILTFPAFFAHLPSMFFIVTPLVGVVGVYYLAILLAADMLRTLGYLLYARWRLPPYQPQPLAAAAPRPDLRQVLRETGKKFLTRLYNILVITIPVFVAVFLAQEGGLFEWLKDHLARGLRGMALPVEAFSILLFALAAETTGGFAAAGALLTAGTLSPGVVLFTLILGTILSSPMRALRHQLPFYLGIYTPALGLRLMILSQTFRALSLFPFLALVYWWGM